MFQSLKHSLNVTSVTLDLLLISMWQQFSTAQNVKNLALFPGNVVYIYFYLIREINLKYIASSNQISIFTLEGSLNFVLNQLYLNHLYCYTKQKAVSACLESKCSDTYMTAT